METIGSRCSSTQRDRYLCLTLLGETAERYGWDVLSYCLMDTHWHLLVRTPEPTLSAGCSA